MMKSGPRIASEKEQENPYTAYAAMDDLLDKLKILNYESEVLGALKIKPLHKYYFVVVKNPGEQFYLFSVLAAWLTRKTGRSFEQPQEDNDPNETIAKITDTCRDIGVTVDFTPTQIKQGVGEHVIKILNSLADEVLKKTNFICQKPKPPEDKEEEAEIIDDEAEINLDRVEEEMIAAYTDDSDEENIFRLDDLKAPRRERRAAEPLAPAVDEESWKLELERVLPQLKITVRNDSRDWRAHLEQMKRHKTELERAAVPAKTQLERVHKDITIALEKIGNREKYLNRELEGILDEYRTLQDELSKVKERYRSVSGGVAERNREFARMSDKLETLKQQMEERGSSMTDGTPLVNIKKAVAKVKSEIVDMDVRIGVLGCVLLQTRIRDEKLLENEFGQTISVY